MDRLKAELLLIAKQRTDIGTTEQHARWINKFVEALQLHFTVEGIKSFTAEQLRDPYVEYMKFYIANGDSDSEAADQVVVRFFHTKKHMRDAPVDIGVNSSVVDIFKKRP